MPILPGPFPAYDENLSTEAGTYAAQLQRLLPPGKAWNFENGSELRKLLVGLADELERIRARGRDLIRESLPPTASETLDEWEQMLSLPDDQVLEIPNTVEERRVVITAKYVAQGGQNYEYFETLCAASGWPLLEIIQGPPQILRVGCRVGDRVFGTAYAYSMELVLDTPTGGAMDQDDFERLIEHVTHGHITVIFTYT